jgi:hypothetical protein
MPYNRACPWCLLQARLTSTPLQLTVNLVQGPQDCPTYGWQSVWSKRNWMGSHTILLSVLPGPAPECLQPGSTICHFPSAHMNGILGSWHCPVTLCKEWAPQSVVALQPSQATSGQWYCPMASSLSGCCRSVGASAASS